MRPPKIPRSVLVVIFTDDGQTLLIERADYPGFWQSVTGSQDEGESFAETAAREVEEETGFRAADFGGLIDLAARKRFNLRVPSVYWRVSESLVVDFSDQAGTRQILPGACRIVEQGDSAAHARVAAVERSLVHGVAVRVDGRLYDTDLSPLTPESQNKRES